MAHILKCRIAEYIHYLRLPHKIEAKHIDRGTIQTGSVNFTKIVYEIKYIYDPKYRVSHLTQT